MYDFIIVGAGVIGASIARELAKYQVKVLVIEKNTDVGDETTCANSAIVHSGYDPHPGTLKALLNAKGNALFDQLCKELDVEFKRIGSLTIATSEEELEILKSLQKDGITNGVNTELISAKKLWEMEPYATKKALGALWAPTAGIVNPFELCVALMENAMDNGVELHLNEKVVNIINNNGSFVVETTNGSYVASHVINAAGIFSDEINNMVVDKKEQVSPRKGEYYVLDHFPAPYVTHTLFSVPSSKGKGILVSPTTHNNYLIGPSSDFVSDKLYKGTSKDTLNNVIKEAYRVVDNIPLQYTIREFTGLRSYHESNDFVINSPVKGFYNLLGIQSPGLASSPAIAEYVLNMIINDYKMDVNNNFNPIRRPLYRVNTLTTEERQALIKKDPNFGKMICRCEQVTLGEVLDCIHRNCGATTVKGVKKRVRPGFGKCQGGFCEPLVTKILCQELGKDLTDIRYSNNDSYLVIGKTKGDHHE